MQLFKFKVNKGLLRGLLLSMTLLSFTTVCSFSAAEAVYAAENAGYSASSNAIEMKLTNYSKVDTSAIKDGNFNVYVNGNKVNLTDKILVVNGNSFLPLRAIGDAIGATTSWDASNKIAKIEFTNNDKITTSIEMSSDCTKMLVNGSTVVNVSNQNTNTATFIDPSTSRIYLPVRAISENLAGVKIEYFNSTRTISITTNGLTPTDPSVDMTEDPDREKPGEGGEVRENPPVVNDSSNVNPMNGERKPDYAGKVNNELSPGGGWSWSSVDNQWYGHNINGGLVDGDAFIKEYNKNNPNFDPNDVSTWL